MTTNIDELDKGAKMAEHSRDWQRIAEIVGVSPTAVYLSLEGEDEGWDPEVIGTTGATPSEELEALNLVAIAAIEGVPVKRLTEAIDRAVAAEWATRQAVIDRVLAGKEARHRAEDGDRLV